MTKSTEAVKASLAIAKAKLLLAKVAGRWPSGAPNGKGGQFAPKTVAGGTQATPSAAKWSASMHAQANAVLNAVTGGNTFHESGWAGSGMWAKPATPPAGAKPHPKVNDHGKPVTINYPTKQSASSTWFNPKATATFTPNGSTPNVLRNVPLKPYTPPKNGWKGVAGTNEKLEANHPFTPTHGKSTGAGVLIVEPDGRVWLTKPTNHFGGYQHTYPKGTVESGLTMQENAIKETWEETGLKVKIVGVLGDYERDTSKARMYIARRVGGTPKDMGWESQAVKLAPMADAMKLLNKPHDKAILNDYMAEAGIHKAAVPSGKPAKGGHWENQPRWPAGTALGGQWKTVGADGLTMPPTIAGGATGTNQSYHKAITLAHAAAQQGDPTAVDAAIAKFQGAADKFASGAKTSSHIKWGAQAYQYAEQLKADLEGKTKASASADAIKGPQKVSEMAMVGAKPGGSNPGAIYQNGKGEQFLVKGNKQVLIGAVTKDVSDDRAKNEVLASKLMQAVGVGAPDMHLVDLEGHFGGGLGVASKMVTGASAFSVGNPSHVSAIQSDFAVHAWLANYDVLGMGFDNTVIKGDKAINIDPGGALLFRAQGLLKQGGLSKTASEFESMRTTTAEQKAVFGKMSAAQLAASAEKLKAIDDATITKLVDTYGPGDAKAKAELTSTLIARRDAILQKAAQPASPASQFTPNTQHEIKLPTGVAALKPIGLKGTGGVYAQSIESYHAKGDLKALQNIKANVFTPTSTGNTVFQGTGKKALTAYLDAAINDLQSKNPSASPAAQGISAAKMDAAVANAVKSLQEKGNAIVDTIKPQTLNVGAWSLSNKAGEQHKKLQEALTMAALSGSLPKMGLVAATAQMWAAGDPKDEDAQAILKAAVAHIASTKQMNEEAAAKVAAAMPSKPKLTKPEFQGEKKFVQYYAGLADKAANAHAAGDLEGLKALAKNAKTGKPAWPSGSINGKLMQSYHDALLTDLGHTADAKVAVNAQQSRASAAVPEPTPPKPTEAKAPNPAMPNFEKFKLANTNSNAASHNAKVDLIAELAAKGDAGGIAALGYSTNTYGKQQAKLANSALQAMGSGLYVTAGQKKNSNGLLNGGATLNQVRQASVKVAQPQPEPHPATLKGKPDMTKLDMSKAVQPPKPVFTKSSKQHVNDQNTALADVVQAKFMAGNYHELASMKFDVLDKESGKVVGQKHMSDHPAKDLKAYFDASLAVMREIAYPPEPLKHFEASAVKSLADLSAAMPGKAFGTTVHKVKSNEKLGFWVALGKISNPDRFMPKKTMAVSQADVAKAYEDYKTKTATNKLAKAFINGIQTSGSYNDLFRDGKETDHNGNKLADVAKAALEYAQEKPEGTTIYRWQHMTADMVKKIEAAGEGTVFQATGSMCTSKSPTATKHFGPHRIQIVYAKGAKAVDSFGSGNFAGEEEITTLPNSRFVIQKVGKLPNGNLDVTVLMLPPDKLGIKT